MHTKFALALVGIIVLAIVLFLANKYRANNNSVDFTNMKYTSDVTRDVLNQMFSAGFKEGQECTVEFAFFGEKIGLNNLRTHMLQSGYSEDTTQTTEILIFAKKMPISYESIVDAKKQMGQIAEQYNVTFDGWSCPVEAIKK